MSGRSGTCCGIRLELRSLPAFIRRSRLPSRACGAATAARLLPSGGRQLERRGYGMNKRGSDEAALDAASNSASPGAAQDRMGLVIVGLDDMVRAEQAGRAADFWGAA